MKKRVIKNLPASVLKRLLNNSAENGRQYNELLQYFVMERFLYRLSESRYRDRFVLKGALMLSFWCAGDSRATRDIDLLGKTENNVENLVSIIKEICCQNVVPDGVEFQNDGVKGELIVLGGDYVGVRVYVPAEIGNARIALQIDIGFGDDVVPGPIKIEYPVLLDFPKPVLVGYSKESVIAEKFHAIVRHGIWNSRMKDFHDILFLAENFDFSAQTLLRAIEVTFKRRSTDPAGRRTVFSDEFKNEKQKQVQWHAFFRKNRLTYEFSFNEAV